MERAPKGGITIKGVFYRGGQFLPANDEPKHGVYNSPRRAKASGKVRKVEIANYEWAPAREGYRPIWGMVAGTVAKPDWQTGSLIYTGNPQTLAFRGLTEEEARDLIDRWNAGERWHKA